MSRINGSKCVARVFMLAVLVSFFQMTEPAKACGLTTHWFVGGIAVDQLKKKRPDLADLLIHEDVMYRRGTTFPDAAQNHLKKKNSKHDDAWSHNQTRADGGFFTAYLNEFRDQCGTDFQVIKDNKDGNCRPALAFFFGMVNHAVADGPWHNSWINKTTADPCRNIPHANAKTGGRHPLADHDIDVCLSSRLNGNPADITAVAATAKAKRTNHKVTFICPDGQFLDLIDGGTCWSCPEGYKRTLYGITGKKACSRPASQKFKKARA